MCRGRAGACGVVTGKSQELLPLWVWTMVYVELCFNCVEGNSWIDACKEAKVCVSRSSDSRASLVIMLCLFFLFKKEKKKKLCWQKAVQQRATARVGKTRY